VPLALAPVRDAVTAHQSWSAASPDAQKDTMAAA